MENLTLPIDGRDTRNEIIASLHGHHGKPSLETGVDGALITAVVGPVGTSLPGLRLRTDGYILNASAQLSTEYQYNRDMNSGDTIGISKSSTTDHGFHFY